MNHCSDKGKEVLQQIMLDYMVQHNITQVALATLLNVSANTISSWLKKGGSGITKAHASRIRCLCFCAKGDVSETHANVQPIMKTNSCDMKEKQQLVKMISDYITVNQISQKEMAARLNVSQACLTNWLKGGGQGISQRNVNQIKYVCREMLTLGNVSNQDLDYVIKFKARLIEAVIVGDFEPETLKKILTIICNVK